MRQIGTIANEEEARRLADYLLTLKIDTEVQRDDDGWSVWVCDEDRLPQAKQELDRFLSDPAAGRYQRAVKQAEAVRHEEVQAEKEYRRRFVDVRERWGDPSPRNYPLTLGMIALSVGVFLFMKHSHNPTDPVRNSLSIARFNAETRQFDPLLEDLRQGQVWRLVTPIFIHFGVLHILFNMMWLYDLGRMIEFRRGTWRLVLLVLTIAVLSNLAQYAWSGASFGGMSGVVFGLFGYVWMKSYFDPSAGLHIHPTNVMLMLVWFVICTLGWVGSIANWAHGVGLAVGVAWGLAGTAWGRLLR